MWRVGVVVVLLIGVGARSEPPGAAEPTLVSFGGRAWTTKAGRKLGPGPNDWSAAPDCVRVEDPGLLRLAIAPAGDAWHCAEVSLPRSLGHGEYRWVVSGDLVALGPRTVLGLFLYEDDEHEVDFELSRWGQASAPNAQFVVQPTAADSLHRFDSGPADRLTVSMLWTPGSVEFRCWAGEDRSRPPIAQWTYAGPKVPRPGQERAIMNLWLMGGKAEPGMKRQEVIIRSFDFRPGPEH